MSQASNPTPDCAAGDKARRRRIPGWLVRRRLIAVGLGVLLVVVAGIRWTIRETSSGAFRGGKLTTNTWSRDLPSLEKRVRFLGRYLNLRSEVLDCAFHIVYHDNGFAPSDWHIVAGIRVGPENLPAWLRDALPQTVSDGFDYQPWLVPQWNVTSAPVFLHRGTTQLAVFEPEGVLVLVSHTQ
jgi:hypothetical protein